MKQYKVVRPLTIKGQRVESGIVELEDRAARILLKSGAIDHLVDSNKKVEEQKIENQNQNEE